MRLIDCFHFWDSLVARVPLGQWKMTGGDDETACSARDCAYCGGKACTHKDKDQVDEGVTFKKALSYTSSDPHAVVALKADIERQLRKLPRLPRALFRLMYQQGGHWETTRKGKREVEQRWVDHNLSMDQARKVLKVSSLRDVATCHDLWLRRMERDLVDWFPAAKRHFDRQLAA